MYAHTIRSLLELHPTGLSNEQLLWRLRSAGIRFSPDDLLQSLGSLIENGEISMAEPGRWRVTAFKQGKGKPTPSDGQGKGRPPYGDLLRAVPAMSAKPVQQDRSSALSENPDGAPADADWKALLRYYAATQRQDPRGRVDERADQHAVSWQLFRTEGHWWGPGELHVSLDALPETFREALTRRPEAVCSVGYPVAVFVQAGVQTFVPALLLAASYRITPSQLIVEVADAEPVINPIWLDMATSRSRWQKEALVDALLPDGEVGDLADITTRMRNGLATIGGTQLRPAQLAGEITPEGEGLRNAAGFFLPSDDRFSRGTERDLEAMQSWPADVVRQTALGHLLTGKGTGASVRLAPAGPMQLTDRQHAAAASALIGPITLIQGPPGTGKSAVILGLLTSIILSGRSVLLASKNHQALDEVEGRLAALIDGAPLFTRGRDREGDRDTSFLAQMRALADGETRAEAAAEPSSLQATLNLARTFDDANTLAARRVALHVQLSEAAEELDRWNTAFPHLPPEAGSRRRLSSHGCTGCSGARTTQQRTPPGGPNS